MDVAQVIAEIDKCRDQVLDNKLWQDGETLHKLQLKLQSLNTYLGEKVAEAEKLSNEAEVDLKYYTATFIRDAKGAVNRAENDVKASNEYKEKADRLTKAIFAHRLLSIKRVDTNNLVDSMRSSLSWMKSEKDKYEKAV